MEWAGVDTSWFPVDYWFPRRILCGVQCSNSIEFYRIQREMKKVYLSRCILTNHQSMVLFPAAHHRNVFSSNSFVHLPHLFVCGWGRVEKVAGGLFACVPVKRGWCLCERANGTENSIEWVYMSVRVRVNTCVGMREREEGAPALSLCAWMSDLHTRVRTQKYTPTCIHAHTSKSQEECFTLFLPPKSDTHIHLHQ